MKKVKFDRNEIAKDTATIKQHRNKLVYNKIEFIEHTSKVPIGISHFN